MPHEPAFVHQLRLMELEYAMARFPAAGEVLEIGAGAGWQAKELSQRGYKVSALEYAHRGFGALRAQSVFPITDYDGVNIPFPDDSFDVVFSSNVLEHVEQEAALQLEIARVLRPSGVAIHIVPSPAWRLWSLISHYIFAFQRLARRRSAANPASTDGTENGAQPSTQKKGRLAKLRYWLIPERHGEVGNFLSELWLFSSLRWRRTFRQAGFDIDAVEGFGAFYTGYGIAGARLSIETRRRLGAILGYSTTLYLLSHSPNPTHR